MLHHAQSRRRRRIEFHERSYREDGGESGKVGYRLTSRRGKLERHLDVRNPRLPKLPPRSLKPKRR